MSIYAINATTFGVAEYTGLGLVGLATIGSKTVGVGTTNLYELTGSDDDSVDFDPYIVTGDMAAVPGQAFNVPKAVIVTEGATTITLSRVTKEQGAEPSLDSYTVTSAAYADELELLLETKNHARSYQFQLDLGSSGVRLDEFLIYVNPVRHRRA